MSSSENNHGGAGREDTARRKNVSRDPAARGKQLVTSKIERARSPVDDLNEFVIELILSTASGAVEIGIALSTDEDFIDDQRMKWVPVIHHGHGLAKRDIPGSGRAEFR